MVGNIDFLKKKIKDSGMTMTTVADRAGIERSTLYNRLNGHGEFTASEILGIAKALKLDKGDINIIFFDSKLN